MGEQTLSQTHHSSPPLISSSSSSAAATATAIITAAASSSPAPSPSPSPSQDPSIPDFTAPSVPPPPATASKLPLRPRKVRKVSSDADATAQPDAANNPPTKQMALRVLPRPLTADGELAAALRHLRAVDPHLARVIDTHDPPSFQSFLPPFHALARSILYQQLACKAGASIYTRFIALCGGEGGVLPDVVLALTPHQLRQIGVSARKASYLHDLARKYQTGILSDAAIVAMDDKSLFSMLTMVKGIGAWSVHMFMIFSLYRPDVLPVGDLGIRKGVQMLYGLEEIPRPSQMEQCCESWRPYRSVGAWYMWRLGESKGTPTIASAGSGELPVAGGGGAAPHQHMQHPELIDPIQMLPNMG